jgi:hypothetical protein
MRSGFRRLILGICAALALVAFSGCSHHEHRKVKVIEEQHEGGVVEEAQGQEMIVE